MNNWEKWGVDVHTEKEQLSKQEKAVGSDCKPYSLDADNCIGEFISPRTSEIYHTTLSDCSCVNFARSNKPCKHMYRLAYELSLCTPPAPLQYGFSRLEALNLFDKLSKEAADLFRSLSCCMGRYSIVEDNSVLRELKDIGFVEVCNDRDFLIDMFLRSKNKDELISMCEQEEGCPKKSSKKVDFIDYIKENPSICDNISELPFCVRVNDSLSGLIKTLDHAYFKKYPVSDPYEHLWL